MVEFPVRDEELHRSGVIARAKAVLHIQRMRLVERLQIDLDAMRGLWVDLLGVSSGFDSVESFDSHLAEAVGEQHLKGAVEHFGSSWRIHREDLTNDLDAVWKAAKAVHETFTEADQKLSLAAPEGRS